MRLFPAIVRRMGRSVKEIPSSPRLLARSNKPGAAPEQTGHISGEKSGRARRARVGAYQSGRGIYQNGIEMAPQLRRRPRRDACVGGLKITGIKMGPPERPQTGGLSLNSPPPSIKKHQRQGDDHGADVELVPLLGADAADHQRAEAKHDAGDDIAGEYDKDRTD